MRCLLCYERFIAFSDDNYVLCLIGEQLSVFEVSCFFTIFIIYSGFRSSDSIRQACGGN